MPESPSNGEVSVSKQWRTPESHVTPEELNFRNTDRTVDNPTMVRGNMWKTSGGSWFYDSKPSSFQISTIGMASTGIDYSSLLPDGTKRVSMQIRGVNGNMVSCATTSAVSSNSYFTLYDTQGQDIGGHGSNFVEQSLFFTGDANDMTVELIIYT